MATFGNKKVLFYYCKICDYKTSDKSNLDKHFDTKKHKINVFSTKTTEQLLENKSYGEPSQLFANISDINSENKNGNALETKTTEKVLKSTKKYWCEVCNKQYIDRSGLWKHKKICPSEVVYPTKSESDILKITTMFLESMKQNQDFQKEVFSIIKNNSHNTNTVTTNNKQKFNMIFFLNETCKDAINLSEFVETLQITLTDLENVGKLGYEEGISRIFTNGLKALDVSRRPIQCSDVKRETVYVKNDNKWDKDSDQLRRAIKLITNKNIKLIPKWKEANPGHHLYHNKKNDEYLKIMYESMGPTDESEEKKSFSKIIANLAKETVIMK
jgi:hypothetical protein